MTILLKLSLILNIVVLLPLCVGFLNNAEWVQASYGDSSPARSILLAVYLAILISSFVFLFYTDTRMVIVLLALQVTYKFVSALTVGSLTHPVVISNIAIAVFHTVVIAIAIIGSSCLAIKIH